ncbi:hypothetical protein Tco_1408187 [Tanacetum coccineum]
MKHVTPLYAQALKFLRFPEEFLCWVGISRNYLLKKDTYPRFEYEDGEEMDLNAFIRTADPRKVRIVERPRTENERPIVTVAKHRTVTLLPTSVSRPSGELSESIEREFGEDGSGGGGQEDASVAGHGTVCPKYMRNLFQPVLVVFAQSCFYSFPQTPVCSFYQSVRLRMFYERKVLLNAYFFTPISEGVVSKLFPIVGYNFSWKTKSAHYVFPYELFYLVSCDSCYWFCFYPLGKVVHGHY